MHVKERLDTAESLMEEYPDSAYRVIENIDLGQIRSDCDKARYALIKYRSADKLNHDITNDSLIQWTAKYFMSVSDKPRAMISYYCIGRAKYDSGLFSASLSSFFQAYNLAKELDDSYWIGLSAFGISYIYIQTNNIGEELHYTRIQYENMRKSGRMRYLDYATLDLARAYNNAHQPDSALYYSFIALDSARVYNDSVLIRYSLDMIAHSYYAKGDYRNGVEYYKNICSMPYASEEDSIHLGLVYIQGNQLDSARHIFDRVKNHEGLFVEEFKYQWYKKNGMYREALTSLENTGRETESILDRQMFSNIISEMNEFMGLELTNLHLREENAKLHRSILFITLIVFTALVFIAIYLIIRSQKMRNRKYLELINDLNNIIHTKESNIWLLIGAQYSIVDQFTRLSKETDDEALNDRRLLKAIKTLVNDLSSEGPALRDLEKKVNRMFDNLMLDFRRDHPDLKEKDYRLLLFSIVGFKVHSIAILLNEKDVNAVYNRRRRLRTKLSNETDGRYLVYLSKSTDNQ